MDEPSEFSCAVIAAAQGKKKQQPKLPKRVAAAQKKQLAKLRKRVADLLDTGYKPTDDDLRALAYYFRYETRGRPLLINNPVQKIVREIRDLRKQDVRAGKRPRSHAKGFDSVMLGWWLRTAKQGDGAAEAEKFADQFEDYRDKVFTELRRSTRSKK